MTKEFFRNISNNNLNNQDKAFLIYDEKLKDIAKKHNEVFYLDIAKIFKDYSPDEIFIDP